MELKDKDLDKLIQKKINDPITQGKALAVITSIFEKKRDDIEALAIAVIALETIKGLPELKQYAIKGKRGKL